MLKYIAASLEGDQSALPALNLQAQTAQDASAANESDAVLDFFSDGESSTQDRVRDVDSGSDVCGMSAAAQARLARIPKSPPIMLSGQGTRTLSHGIVCSRRV